MFCKMPLEKESLDVINLYLTCQINFSSPELHRKLVKITWIVAELERGPEHRGFKCEGLVS